MGLCNTLQELLYIGVGCVACGKLHTAIANIRYKYIKIEARF